MSAKQRTRVERSEHEVLADLAAAFEDALKRLPDESEWKDQLAAYGACLDAAVIVRDVRGPRPRQAARRPARRERPSLHVLSGGRS